MKVKIFADSNLDSLEKSINDYLEGNNIKVVNIKYSGSENLSEALIMYEEIKV